MLPPFGAAMFCSCLTCDEDAAQIQLNRVQKDINVGVGKIQIFAGIGSAEVVDQNIQSPFICHGILHHRVKAFRLGCIIEYTVDAATLCVQGIRDFLRLLRISGCHIDNGTFSGTGFNAGKTDAARRSGDQYDLIFQSHAGSPFL